MAKRKNVCPTIKQQKELLNPWILGQVTAWLRGSASIVFTSRTVVQYSYYAEAAVMRHLKGEKRKKESGQFAIDIAIPLLAFKLFKNTFPEFKKK